MGRQDTFTASFHLNSPFFYDSLLQHDRLRSPVTILPTHPGLNHTGLELQIEQPLEEKVKETPGPGR